MTYPTTTAHLLQRMREVTEMGLGSVRIIPADYFSSDAYPGKPEDAVAREVMWKPQIHPRIGKWARTDFLSDFSADVLYDVTFVVEFTHDTDSELMRDKRTEIESTVLDMTHKVIGALTQAANLEYTADGTYTGLLDGKLRFVSAGDIAWDYNRHTVKQTINFIGVFGLRHT